MENWEYQGISIIANLQEARVNLNPDMNIIMFNLINPLVPEVFFAISAEI